MTDPQPSAARQMLGGFADKLVEHTDDVLFAAVWERPELSPSDRSLVTITALVAGGNVEQLGFHLGLGQRNGLTQDEIVEAITHLAFYTGGLAPCPRSPQRRPRFDLASGAHT